MRAAAVLVAFFSFVPAALAQEAPPAPPRELASGVHLLPDAFPPGRGPDGATVIFDAPDGLVVVDTGRHAWRTDQILAFASERNRPIAAILNTHWHLDHASGNRRLKAVFPNAPVYTTRAVDGAITGFLGRNLEGVRERLRAGSVTNPVQAEEMQIFVDTMDHADSLRADRAVERSGVMVIAGRALDLRVTDGAVTEADLWLFDPASGVAVLGDLVTLPAPFFETACPERWRAALDDVWATPFTLAVPGHGAPMTRDQFATYRAAYNVFINCAASARPANECAPGWERDVAPLIGEDPRMREAAVEMAAYYVGYLRDNGGKSLDCRSS